MTSTFRISKLDVPANAGTQGTQPGLHVEQWNTTPRRLSHQLRARHLYAPTTPVR